MLGGLRPGQQALGGEVDRDRIRGGPADPHTGDDLLDDLVLLAAGDDLHLVPGRGQLLRERLDMPAQAAHDERRVLPRQHQHPHGEAD